MKNDIIRQLARVRADGGSRACPPERLVAIKDEFKSLCRDAGVSANDRRELAEDIRFCRWPGQSADGRKHTSPEKEAFPFEGASDARIRLTDGTVNEQVMILMAALLRANLTFKGGASPETGGDLRILWDHLLSRHLGAEWFTEWTKAAQWRQGDSPAVAIVQIWWEQETILRTVDLTTEEFTTQFLALLAEQDADYAQSPEAAGEIQAMLADPAAREILASALIAIYPEMSAGRAAKVAANLQERGAAAFPYPQVKGGRLRMKARRLFDDFFAPENTPTNLQRGRIMWVREWVPEVELREREAKGEFRPGFVAEVLKHEGTSGWAHVTHYDNSGAWQQNPLTRDWDKDRQRGLFELITAYYRAANEDGVAGVYAVTYHHAVDFAGTDEELQNYPGGKYPFVASAREIIGDTLWQSRGVCELGSTEQQSLKLLHDSFMDHAQLTTVPPLEVPATRPNMKLVIGPLAQVKVNRRGEIGFMSMGQYPQTNDKVQRSIMAQHDRYFGRIADGVPPDLVRLYGQHLVDFFLIDADSVVGMALEIALKFASDDELAAIFGEERRGELAAIRAAAEEMDIELSFEAGMLQFDFLKEIGNLITSYVLSWDTQSTIRRDELVSWFMSAISPQLARRVLRPVKEANAAETEDEQNNFAKIAAGVEPEMKTAGQDFGLRLEVELGIAEQNPEAIARLSPTSRRIWEARVQHLQGMVKQEQNKLIGRTMARSALGPDAAAA